MSIKRTGGRKPTMGNWRCEYMAQSEYAVCKCCHINGDLHMDARQIYRRILYPMTRALLATCALGLTPLSSPTHVFSPRFPRLSHAMQRTGAIQICEYIFHSRRSNAFPRCLHAVSESIENVNGDTRTKRENGDIHCSRFYYLDCLNDFEYSGN